MKTKLIKMLAGVATVAGLSLGAQANLITGSIGFTGNYTQTGGSSSDLSTATSLTLVGIGISVPAESGALLGATLDSYTSPIYVNGNTPTLASPNPQLWEVNVGTTFYTFIVTSEAQTLGVGNTTLTLAGNGIMEDGTPADNTYGTWTLAFGVSGAALTFNSTSASAPDGGSTVMMLGAALSALGLFRKKLMA